MIFATRCFERCDMAENLQEHPSIGECPQCGQQFFGLWVIGETLLEIHWHRTDLFKERR
jgi:hypothetical protein